MPLYNWDRSKPMYRLLLLTMFLTIVLATPGTAQNSIKGTGKGNVTGKMKSSSVQGGAIKGKAKGGTVKPKMITVKHRSGKPATTIAPKPASYKPEAPPILMRRPPAPLRVPSKGTVHKP